MNKQLGILITAFFVILIGVVLISTIGDQSENTRDTDTVTDDQFVSSNISCTRVATGCIVTLTSVTNTTGSAIGARNYTLCRSTTGYQDGIKLNDYATADGSTISGKTLNATYSHSASCNYVADTTTRTLMNLNTLWFALIIVLIAVAAFYKMKEGTF